MLGLRIKKAYFDAPDGQVHYRYLLSTRFVAQSPCVFLHSSGGSSVQFEKLMRLHAGRGHDCFAPDLPGFGSSYDPADQPSSTGYYVDVLMRLFRSLNLPRFHLFGHQSGANLATEIAAKYPSCLLSVCISAPPSMTPNEQKNQVAQDTTPFNQPVADGSHLLKTWEHLKTTGDDLQYRQQEALDHIRSWKGIPQLNMCVSEQDTWGLVEKVGCPVLALCARDDIFWHQFHCARETRPEVRCEEVAGGDLSPSRNPEAVAKLHFEFLDKLGSWTLC
ncbi:putative lysophospholipase [Lachnellula suecica]|uniref:Putative lysophospholipase n=1 Tax=Lachnellula suecica TaxID=602035 RepID=A0A8T9C770_9HELO|nr:putative lysophospholipase [Lachnellula suecica]